MRILLLLLLVCLTAQAEQAPASADNPEMARIFAEDQADRQGPIDWKVVTPRDVARRARVKELLAQDELKSSQDFHGAAFVFQHGSEPKDYLLAHTLAMVAVKLGDDLAIWIASATLDRYLQSIGQPQIYGTQYRRPAGTDWTQQPMDEDLISDALRVQLDVPVRSAQKERLEQMK